MSWQVKIDVNKAFDQMNELGQKVWNKFQDPATACVIELLNQTSFDFRHVGNYRWQGNFMEPTDNLQAGYGCVWGMESKGIDGSFGCVNYELYEKDQPTGIFLMIGNLVYWDGAQPKYTAKLGTTNFYNEGKPKNLSILDEGKSSAWNYDFNKGGVNVRVNTDIWREKITDIEENFRIQLTTND